MAEKYTIEDLEEAIHMANDWIRKGEGVDLLYYARASYLVENLDQVKARITIQSVLEKYNG